MNESWYVFRSGPGNPAWNMAMDEALLEAVIPFGRPVLRFYSWSEPAATFGYFQRYADIQGWTSLRPLIRRPTGGGLVPHDRDWTYSLVFPPGHYWYNLSAEESYRRVHAWISSAFNRLRLPTELASCCVKNAPGRCFIGAEKFDLLLAGQKIAGAAQRRNKFGLLIQGSIQSQPQNISRQSWEEAMLNVASGDWQVRWSELPILDGLQAGALRMAQEKYSREEYNRKR